MTIATGRIAETGGGEAANGAHDGDSPSARRAEMDTTVAIETPEHIVFRYRVAGPARRMLAYLLDLVVCYGALFVIGIVLFLAFVGASAFDEARESFAKVGEGIFLVLLFAAQWVYFVLLETWTSGRTVGKIAAGLRVVTTSGRPIGFTEAALRNVLRAADALPTAYAVGLVSMALTTRFQRLGDLVAGTMVIVPDRARAADAIRLWPPIQPNEVAALEAAGEIALDADERAAIEMFLRRRGTLGPMREMELASMIAEPLCARAGFRASDPVRALALLHHRVVADSDERRDAGPRSSIAPPPSMGGGSFGGERWR